MIYRTTPFGLRREIDRLFEDAFGRGDGQSSWNPPVDVRESDNEMRLELELPGISPDQVEVTAENGVLTVRGEKRSERKEGEDNDRFHMVERSYGSFTRSFQLPQGLDESKIEADFDNGVLSIHVPKTALPQPRKIEIGASKQKQIDSSASSRTGTPKEKAAKPAASIPANQPNADASVR
jgi:HSP20 family protein